MTFATPQRFVVITELSRRRQRLYGVGYSIVDPADPNHNVKIQQIETKRFKVSDSRTKRSVWLAQGELLPGFPDRRYTKTALLKGVDHHYVATVAPLDPEPRLLGIGGDRATLQTDIPPPDPIAALPPRQDAAVTGQRKPTPAPNGGFEDTLLSRVRVKEISHNTYEVSAADLQDAMEHGGQVLAEMWPKIWPMVSAREGVSLDVQSPVASGVVGPQGFKVTAPNLARRAGIEVGDVILEIDGNPVNSVASLYSLYKKAMSEPLRSQLQLKLERQGQPVTKTYRIR